MKKLIFLLASLLIASTAYAGNPAKIGFMAYSTVSTTPVQCGVFGMLKSLARDDQGVPIQGFAPNPALSRTYNIGWKKGSFANYSTDAVRAVSFSCRLQPLTAATASTAVRVKVFMNGVETHFLTLSEGTIFIGQ
jgi:hypothetical protein